MSLSSSISSKSPSIKLFFSVFVVLNFLANLPKINFATIVKIDDEIKEKKELEKIILCDVQIEIYPDLEKSLLDILHNSGYPGIKFEKKIDFEKLYNQRLN